MALSYSSTWGPDGETIDLTGPEATAGASRTLGLRHKLQLVDLTLSANEEPIPPLDHMHTVVDLIRPGPVDLTGNEPKTMERNGLGLLPVHLIIAEDYMHPKDELVAWKSKKKRIQLLGDLSRDVQRD